MLRLDVSLPRSRPDSVYAGDSAPLNQRGLVRRAGIVLVEHVLAEGERGHRDHHVVAPQGAARVGQGELPLVALLGVDLEDDQSFELTKTESNPSRKRIICCVNRSLGEMELLQTELRPFLAQLKLNGFEITFVDLPDVSFDYKTISSADIRSDMAEFLQRFGSDNEPRSFEELVERYRERRHTRALRAIA